MCKKVLLLFVCNCLFVSTVWGASINWEGGVSDDWTDLNNWAELAVPTSADIAVIVGDNPNYAGGAALHSPDTADAVQVLLGKVSNLTVDAGAILNVGGAGFWSGWVDDSTLNVFGTINAASLGMGNAHWDDGVGGPIFNGHSTVNIDGGIIDTGGVYFGEPAFLDGLWQNPNGGTGEIFITNGGTLKVTGLNAIGGIFDHFTANKCGFNISSADPNNLMLVNASNPSSIIWWSNLGNLTADSGWGTIKYDTFSNPGFYTIWAEAYNPATAVPRALNTGWDFGGGTNSMADHWNFQPNLPLRPIDIFVTTGGAPLGQHPVLDFALDIPFASIGYDMGAGTDDVLEITNGGVLTIDGGDGGLVLGDNGAKAAPAKGTLIMSGGTLNCSSISVGGSMALNTFAQCEILMSDGYIDCNDITLAIIGIDDPNIIGVGSLALDGGTINISNSKALLGVHESNGIDITGGTLIIEGDMAGPLDGCDVGLNCEIAWLHSLGKITAYGGAGTVIVDYDLRNAGKTTITATDCQLPGDLDGNCYVDITDLQIMAFNWLTTVPNLENDSIFLFNETGALPGYWSLALNNDTPGAYLPISSLSGGYTPFNDVALTPNPNKPLVGDLNGDGVADIVTVGDNGSQDLFLGRNTGTTANVGNLSAASIGGAGWPDNFVGTDIASYGHFLADVDGDGYDDAITVKATGWDPLSSFWEAYHSDADGLEGAFPDMTWSVAGQTSSTPLIGDFNGDGAMDIAERLEDGLGTIITVFSELGLGLVDPNTLYNVAWGGVANEANRVATLVGDINGDGLDDIVEVDDRNANGNWTWVAGLTAENADPSGYGINAGGTSWAYPFSLDVNSTLAVPLLADINNDGRDDLILYEEYLDIPSGNIWARVLASYTDSVNPDHGLHNPDWGTYPNDGNAFDEATFFDFTGTIGVDVSGNIPLVGDVHSCDLIGDINLDCTVNLLDLAALAQSWLQSAESIILN